MRMNFSVTISGAGSYLMLGKVVENFGSASIEVIIFANYQ